MTDTTSPNKAGTMVSGVKIIASAFITAAIAPTM